MLKFNFLLPLKLLLKLEWENTQWLELLFIKKQSLKLLNLPSNIAISKKNNGVAVAK